ncbi:hypothetical protein BC832DRAFT_78714 [Gaertneriomyces semiglobifer]|nr:hypothetical protein BC832DRAFT_78714 [Gaertneriomyces semiglobifer]
MSSEGNAGMEKKRSAWVPLESNPQVLNEYAERLGVSSSWSFTDVWGLDEDLLSFISRPVLAVLLLFPITQQYESFREQEEQSIRKDGQTVSPDIFFVRQTIPNACGTIGLLHALANNTDTIQVGDGPLKRILAETRSKSPEERAGVLEASEDLARVHEESSQSGQTAPPPSEEDVDTHFICFVRKDGCVYELDGRKPFPVNHGSCEDLLKGAVEVIRTFIAREPDNPNFTVMALTPAADD